jgi:hypothetical protein
LARHLLKNGEVRCRTTATHFADEVRVGAKNGREFARA